MRALKDNELQQASVRLAVAGCAALYVAVVSVLPGSVFASFAPVLAYSVFFLIVSALLRRMIKRRPGYYPLRRLAEMLHDYAAITFAMVLGGEAALPLYAVLLWVTVGNGLRFGREDLAIATALGLGSLALSWYMTPMWRAHPFMVATLGLAMVAVPSYACFLTRQAHRIAAEHQRGHLENTRFLAQASHDLRQPIQSIGLFTTCLRDGPLDATQQRMVDNIDQSLINASQLFRRFLDGYEMDRRPLLPIAQAVDLHQLVQEVLRPFEQHAQASDNRLRVRVTRHFVESDPALLSRMLQNLIANALKYAPGSRILIGTRRCATGWSLQVHDSGPGIAKGQLGRLFDEFYRSKASTLVQGQGLGLAIVKKLARSMAIDVKVSSRPGHGTSVSAGPLRAIAAAPPLDLLQGLRVWLEPGDGMLAVEQQLCAWACEVVGPEQAHEVRIARQWLPGYPVRQIIIGAAGDHDGALALAEPVDPAQLRSVLLSSRSALAGQPVTGS